MSVQEITVTRGDSFTIGNAQYYTGGRFPTATIVTVNGANFLEIGADLYTECGWCQYGTKTQHMGVYGGVCFQCNGSGFGRKVGTVEAAAKIVRRRATDAARRERKAAEKAAAGQAAGAAWRAANPDLADLCEAIYAEMAEAGDHADPNAAYDAYDVVQAAWGSFVTQLANLVGMGRPLTENQTAALPQAIDDAVAEQAAEQARQNAARYLGTKGDKIVATGTVAVSMTIEVESYSGYGTDLKRLVIVEGTGEFTGVTFKIFSTAKAIWETESGQSVEVRGTVKAHDEYEGTKQTVLTYAKVKVVE